VRNRIVLALDMPATPPFNKDSSTLRTSAPQAIAIIRNTLIPAFPSLRMNNLKHARRHFSHIISNCANLITKPIKTVKSQA